MIGFTLEEAFVKLGMFLYPQNTIKACYGQEHRLYHNLDHIGEMLKHVPHEHPEVEIMLDAILFHDIVYSPKPEAKGLNEALSAAEYILYNTKLLAFDNPFGSNGDGSVEYEIKVIGAIIATAHHLEDQMYLTDVAKWVLDLDLSTFALPWDEYLVWKDKIEKENALIWSHIEPKLVVKGRCTFLKKLLERQQLYYVKTEWEQQARDNITREVEEIQC